MPGASRDGKVRCRAGEDGGAGGLSFPCSHHEWRDGVATVRQARSSALALQEPKPAKNFIDTFTSQDLGVWGGSLKQPPKCLVNPSLPVGETKQMGTK